MGKYRVNREKTGMNINKKIREKEISLDELAEQLGFESPRVIYEWLRGTKQPSLESSYSLSLILECRIEDIIVFEAL